MGRTTVEINDELIALVMRRYGFKTKGEAVNYALKQLRIEPMTKEEALAMEGTGWGGDLDELRAGTAPRAWHTDGE